MGKETMEQIKAFRSAIEDGVGISNKTRMKDANGLVCFGTGHKCLAEPGTDVPRVSHQIRQALHSHVSCFHNNTSNKHKLAVLIFSTAIPLSQHTSMAIADNSSDISCSVVVDGKPLLAYADDNTKNEDNETTRYVEVATGQSYKIEYSIGPDFETHSYGVAVYLIIDGEEVDKRIHHPQDVEFGHTSTFTNVVYNIGNRYCAATFKFGNVDIGARSMSLSGNVLANIIGSRC